MIKSIIVECSKGFKQLNKPIRPGEINKLNIKEIFMLLRRPGVKVFEINEDATQRIQLNKDNYDKTIKFVMPNAEEKKVVTTANVKTPESSVVEAKDEKLAVEEETINVKNSEIISGEPVLSIEEPAEETKDDTPVAGTGESAGEAVESVTGSTEVDTMDTGVDEISVEVVEETVTEEATEVTEEVVEEATAEEVVDEAADDVVEEDVTEELKETTGTPTGRQPYKSKKNRK